MHLPFKQLPELSPGKGLLVGAPHGGGTTFFLSRLAIEACKQDLKVVYFGHQDGNVWLLDMTYAGGDKLKFVNFQNRLVDSRTLERAILSTVTTGLIIIDGLDQLVRQVPDRKGSETGYLTHIINTVLAEAASKQNLVAFGVTVPRMEAPPQKPEGADSWSWRQMYITPVVHKMETAHKEWDKLTVVKLLKETT